MRGAVHRPRFGTSVGLQTGTAPASIEGTLHAILAPPNIDIDSRFFFSFSYIFPSAKAAVIPHAALAEIFPAAADGAWDAISCECSTWSDDLGRFPLSPLVECLSA